jgi:hypothetical protein
LPRAERSGFVVPIATALTFAFVLSSCTTHATSLPPLPSGNFVSINVDAAAKSTGLINKNLIGVNGPGPSQSYQAMRLIGVHWVRTDVSFEGTYDGRPVYNCTTGSWNPALLDAKVAGIHREGGTPLEIVDYSPTCLSADPFSSDPEHAPPDVGADRPKWDALVTQMAVHEIRAENVRYFEVWNEPDWVFFSGGLQGYLRLYADTARSLENAAAELGVRISVGGPALADVLDTQNIAWLQPLLSYVTKGDLPIDFISWHSYANDPYAGPANPGAAPICGARAAGPGTNLCYYNPNLGEETIAKEVAQTKQLLDGYPGLHPLLIVDEWNIDGYYDARQDGPFDGAYVAAVLESAQQSGLDGMSFFFDANSPTNPDANWGLLNRDFKPKPAYESFLYWHTLAPDQVSVSIAESEGAAANSDANGRVGAVASTSHAHTVTVLLYNFKPYDLSGDYGTSDPTPYDRVVVLNLKGLQDVAYAWSRDLVDGTHKGGRVARGNVEGTSARLVFDLAGQAVTMITLSPH